MMDLGPRVRERRSALGISQEQLARRADVSLNAVHKLEMGKITDPHFSTLSAIAAGLQTTVADLVGEEAGKASAPPESGLSEAERPSVAVGGIFSLLERWYDRRQAEVSDPASLYFRDATSAALWVADTREEANDFILFLAELIEKQPKSFEGIWDAVRLFLVGLALDNPPDRGEARLQEMGTAPDELAARRMERATAEARVSMERLQELGEAPNG